MVSASAVAVEKISVSSKIILTASLDCEASLECKMIRASLSS